MYYHTSPPDGEAEDFPLFRPPKCSRLSLFRCGGISSLLCAFLGRSSWWSSFEFLHPSLFRDSFRLPPLLIVSGDPAHIERLPPLREVPYADPAVKRGRNFV